MNTTAFGSRLRELREEKSISLRELAKRIGVSGAFLSDIELGRRFPSTEILELIANEIGVPSDELKKYDFRDEAEAIKKMMFADPAAGMAFRTILRSGVNLEELVKKLPPKKKS